MPLPPGSLLELPPAGLYCRAAAAWIDPWRPVARALITHAHADHARPGCGEYWAVGASEAILRQRLGAAINLIPVDYGKLRHGMEALKALMDTTDKVQIKGPDTDLRFSIKGIGSVI